MVDRYANPLGHPVAVPLANFSGLVSDQPLPRICSWIDWDNNMKVPRIPEYEPFYVNTFAG